MKKIFFILVMIIPLYSVSQNSDQYNKDSKNDLKMKIGMVIYSNDAETVWNAFRFGNFAIGEGDSVKVFLLAKGVEVESLDSDKFKVTDQIKRFVENGGKIFACGTCLTIRKKEGSEMCPLSTMQDMYEIIKWSNKIITF
ncbi:MAG: DsrE family protein [Bacteroidales bacterium]|nr:DsrE family protein [Bacteroidales bacterium]